MTILSPAGIQRGLVTIWKIVVLNCEFSRSLCQN